MLLVSGNFYFFCLFVVLEDLDSGVSVEYGGLGGVHGIFFEC